MLRRRQILVAPQPVTSMPRRLRMHLHLGLRLARWLLMLLRRCRSRMSLLSPKQSPSVRQTGTRNRQCHRQTGSRQPFRPVNSLPHFSSPVSRDKQSANLLRIRCHILLQIQIIQQLEIRIHVVILF